MSDDYEVQAGPEVKVARDLSEILRMIPMLDEQAEHKANATIDGHGLPGGMAMVTLAPVANLEAWANRVSTAERTGQDTSWLEDEDSDWEPVLYTLSFWSEQWRRERDAEYGQRPTIHSEANFIKSSLPWAWDHEPAWDDMAKDIKSARRRMENVLYAGERAQRGVPCMYDECRGSRLIRKLEPCRDENGDKSWRWANWHCVKCKRSWTAEAYESQISAANWAAQFEEVLGETWCSVKYASRQTGVPEVTIRVWLTRTKSPKSATDHEYPISLGCLTAGRRLNYVRLADVERRRDRPKKRKAAA